MLSEWIEAFCLGIFIYRLSGKSRAKKDREGKCKARVKSRDTWQTYHESTFYLSFLKITWTSASGELICISGLLSIWALCKKLPVSAVEPFFHVNERCIHFLISLSLLPLWWNWRRSRQNNNLPHFFATHVKNFAHRLKAFSSLISRVKKNFKFALYATRHYARESNRSTNSQLVEKYGMNFLVLLWFWRGAFALKRRQFFSLTLGLRERLWLGVFSYSKLHGALLHFSKTTETLRGFERNFFLSPAENCGIGFLAQSKAKAE